MADAIISRLAALENLAVRPTNSVLKYATQSVDPIEAARELKVDSVLAGNYQAQAGVLRVSVQLIDRGATRWGKRYDLKGTDMLRFQDDVAREIVESLSVQLSGAEQQHTKARSTNSPEAYNLLVQARAYFNEYSSTSRVESLEQGEGLARQAIALDGSYADAYTVLAELYGWQASNFPQEAERSLAEAEQAARKALTLDPASEAAKAILGGVLAEAGKKCGGAALVATSRGASPQRRTDLGLFGICLPLRWAD